MDARTRLPSLDLLRGLALTIVLIDHIELLASAGTTIRRWTLIGLGFSDAAEVFFFVSGVAFGHSYSARLSRAGFLSCQRRSLVRAVQIYIAYVVTTSLVVLLSIICSDGPASFSPALETTSLRAFPQIVMQVASLSYRLPGFGILPVYVVTLPLMPAALAVASRLPWLALCASLLVYVVVQVEAVHDHDLTPEHWLFNPFAWQILLVSGAIVGQRWIVMTSLHADAGVQGGSLRKKLVKWSIAPVAVGVIAVGIAVKRMLTMAGDFELSGSADRIVQTAPFLFAKSTLGPIRLIHFAAIAYFTSLVLPLTARTWSYWPTAWLIAAGRHSLPVYCCGTLLAYLGIPTVRLFGQGTASVIFISFDACVIQLCVAHLLDRALNQAERVPMHETAFSADISPKL